MRQLLKASYPLETSQGQPRRLGVELELAGLALGQLLSLLQTEVGGSAEKLSDYEAVIRGSSLGTIKIEFDAAMFREFKVKQLVADLDSSLLESLDREALERALAGFAQWVVPFELVFEPLALVRLPELDAIVSVPVTGRLEPPHRCSMPSACTSTPTFRPST